MQKIKFTVLTTLMCSFVSIGCGFFRTLHTGQNRHEQHETDQNLSGDSQKSNEAAPTSGIENTSGSSQNIQDPKGSSTTGANTAPSDFEKIFDAKNPLAELQSITQDEAVAALEPIFNLEGQKCESCHFNWKSQIKEWAFATKNQALENRALFGPESMQAKAQLQTEPEKVKGIFKAYPEYFEQFFLEEGNTAAGSSHAKFSEFAALIQPQSAGGQMAFQTQRFLDSLTAGPAPVRNTQNMQGSQINLSSLSPLDSRAKADFYQALNILLRISVTPSLESGALCKTEISESYKLHIREMQVSGFQNLYKTATLYGCSVPGIDGTQCFESYERKAGSAGSGTLLIQNKEIHHRLVKVQDIGETSFWARSSMDGRFIANGDKQGKVQDLEKKIQWNFKGTKYDPSFLPNGAGLSFHGEGAVFCTMDAITRTPTAEERANSANLKWIGSEPWLNLEIDPENSPHCIHGNMTSAIGTYQSVGNVIGMGKTYVLAGSHLNDNGIPRSPTLDFSGIIDLFEVTKKPRNFGEVKKITSFKIPGEGDAMISPSARYISSRLAGKPGEFDEPIQLGFKLRSLKEMLATVQVDSTNTFDASLQEDQSTLCTVKQPGNSSKAMMSLDERFMVFHMYDAPYREGQTQAPSHTNIYLFDLLYPEAGLIQVTAFSGNTQALFPHFRADGWLLFIVRDQEAGNDQGDELFASDIAVQLSKQLSALEPIQQTK